MLRERLRIRTRAQLVQELCRALHIGEEEGDGSGGEIPSHGPHDVRKQVYVEGTTEPDYRSLRTDPALR